MFRIAVTISALLTGCGAYYERGQPVPLDYALVPWADQATDGAAAFWSRHGVSIGVGDPSGYRVAVEPLLPEALGNCGDGRIAVDPSLASKSQGARCVIAHEIGHLIGMNHVSQSESLMSPILALPPDPSQCWWSDLDQFELAAALKQGHSVCP